MKHKGLLLKRLLRRQNSKHVFQERNGKQLETISTKLISLGGECHLITRT